MSVDDGTPYQMYAPTLQTAKPGAQKIKSLT